MKLVTKTSIIVTKNNLSNKNKERKMSISREEILEEEEIERNAIICWDNENFVGGIRFRRNDVFHGSTSTAIKMLRDAVKYGNYKLWDCEVGNKKAQDIIDEFHSGKYDRRDGFWVQINWAIEKIKKTLLDGTSCSPALFCDIIFDKENEKD